MIQTIEEIRYAKQSQCAIDTFLHNLYQSGFSPEEVKAWETEFRLLNWKIRSLELHYKEESSK